ncbi:flagellar hook-length control protein FliK [Herminiimonas sp. KBW02]|uniref:flagellar hook-length control protein FliK n=1 Tax=Herminiimonas sp. KBW02 TaxID=2153363 RepID=UPI000F5AF13A|nr:flagellar hook-length control protein FliK [Herminiimonas sp. KBW02]RQO33264.1 flagellar hook-length control protein FliK [Herminiimonas sp. KBW02]
MNTTAVNSPLTVLQAPVPGSKPDSAPSADAGSFNQVLSREMSNRGNTTNNASEASKNPGKDTSANQGDKTKTDTGPTTEAAKPAEDGKVAAPETKTEDLDNEPVTVSAELLAFVAALTQANTATVASTAPAASADAELGVSVKSDTEVDSAVDTKLNGNLLTAAADSEKEAIGKKSDFVAALDKASKGGADAKNTPAAAATPAKTEIDLATAITQGAKALEPATVSNPQNVAAVTAAALQQLNDAQGPQSNKIAPQVGNPGWDQAIGQKVLWMVQGAQQSATLTLNPPDLGPMQVTVHVNNNQATANFTAHQPEVRHALEAAMPRLREMLNDAGIQLGQSNVSAGTPNQQGGFGEQRQSSGTRQSNQIDIADAAVHVSHVPTPASSNGLVDTFA